MNELDELKLKTNHLIECDEKLFRIERSIKVLLKSLNKTDLANLLIESGLARRDYTTGVVRLK